MLILITRYYADTVTGGFIMDSSPHNEFNIYIPKYQCAANVGFSETPF
jgi:hypothetical protein